MTLSIQSAYQGPPMRDFLLFMAKEVGDVQPVQAYEKFTPPRK